MPETWRTWPPPRRESGLAAFGHLIGFYERGQRRGTDAKSRSPKELTAGEKQFVFSSWVHGVLVLGKRLVQIQNHVADQGPGGVLGRRDRGVAGRFAHLKGLRRLGGVGLVLGAGVGEELLDD